MRSRLYENQDPRRQRELFCLKCDKKFTSVGPHNRLCDTCRGQPEPELSYPILLGFD
jgi:hypothetical protein